MNFVLTRTEQILGDSAVPPPPQPVSSSLGANASGRPVRQAARIRRSDMVVIDGIVMGHTVSIIVSKWIDLHIFISIVHMRTAFLTWLMHVVVFIVDIMRISMEENVMLPIAQVIRKLEHRPV